MDMICAGCGKPASEYGDIVIPEPNEAWHAPCWQKVFWHTQDGGGNPRPMTDAEKETELDRLRCERDERLWKRFLARDAGPSVAKEEK